MALKLKVPNIVCDGCAETITESITTMEPKVEVDKTVTVRTAASEETIKQAITAAGYTIEGYQ